jgi:hypothetical protein
VYDNNMDKDKMAKTITVLLMSDITTLFIVYYPINRKPSESAPCNYVNTINVTRV